jgi:hypothetical protein
MLQLKSAVVANKDPKVLKHQTTLFVLWILRRKTERGFC